MGGKNQAGAGLAVGLLISALLVACGALTSSSSASGQPIASRIARTPAPARDSVSVVFRVHGLRSDHGQIMGALYDSPRHWVRPGEHAADCRADIRGRVARCVMQVRPGRYAFAFAHDEDGDGELDRDFLGIPSEGYGFSNDVRPALALPSWQSAAFDVSGRPSGELVVTTRYGI